ncbi:MAG: cytochrome c [Bacteroidota bacterium]
MKQILPILAVLLLFACSKSAPTEATSEKAVAENLSPQQVQGKKVYNTYCFACHMQDGNGVPGLNPPLIGTDWVLGDKERLIGVVLNGMSEPIEIDGELYSNVMNPHAFLSDADIAAVLTYVRSAWGNDAGPLTAAEVASVRAKQ